MHIMLLKKHEVVLYIAFQEAICSAIMRLKQRLSQKMTSFFSV